MAAEGVIFFIFTILLQYKFFIRFRYVLKCSLMLHYVFEIIHSMSLFRPLWAKLPPLGPEDEDVARERERVKGGKAQSDILTMIDLSKV